MRLESSLTTWSFSKPTSIGPTYGLRIPVLSSDHVSSTNYELPLRHIPQVQSRAVGYSHPQPCHHHTVGTSCLTLSTAAFRVRRWMVWLMSFLPQQPVYTFLYGAVQIVKRFPIQHWFLSVLNPKHYVVSLAPRSYSPLMVGKQKQWHHGVSLTKNSWEGNLYFSLKLSLNKSCLPRATLVTNMGAVLFLYTYMHVCINSHTYVLHIYE